MIDIPGPNQPNFNGDRNHDCEHHLEAAFTDLAMRAEAAGWSEGEVAAALLDLAKNHIMRLIASNETDRMIARTIAKLNRQPSGRF